jgi:hypothetical protein
MKIARLYRNVLQRHHNTTLRCTHLHIACAWMSNSPYVEQAVETQLHTLVLEQLDAWVGAWQVDHNLPFLRGAKALRFMMLQAAPLELNEVRREAGWASACFSS